RCCVCVEHHHMVVRFAFKLESRAHWWALRSSAGDGARRLVSHKVERRCVAKSCCADDHIATRWIYLWRTADVLAFRRASLLHAALRKHAVWQAANLQRSVDGTQPWLERRAKNDGHHRTRAFYRHESRQLRSFARRLRFPKDSDLHPARLGRCSLRADDGSWNRRGRLANHSHARPSHGEIATREWLRCRNHRRIDYTGCKLLRHSAFNHTCNHNVNYGRRRRETFQRNEVDCRRTNYLGLAFHAAGQWTPRICARAC